MRLLIFLLIVPLSLDAQSLKAELMGTWKQTNYAYIACSNEQGDYTEEGEGIYGLKRIRFEEDQVVLMYENKPREAYPYTIQPVGENGFSVKMKLKKRFLRKQKYKYLFCEEFDGGTLELNEWSNGCDSKQPDFYREIFYSFEREQKTALQGSLNNDLLHTWVVEIESNFNLLADADTIRLKKRFSVSSGEKPLNGCLQVLTLRSNQLCFGYSCCISGCLTEGKTKNPDYNRWSKKGSEIELWNSHFKGSALANDVHEFFHFEFVNSNELLLIRK